MDPSSACERNTPSASGNTKLIPSTFSQEGHGEPSSSNQIETVQDELQDFRDKWQKELQISSMKGKEKPETSVPIIKQKSPDGNFSNHENKARSLFLKGVEMEKSGKLYEAIQFYRKAIQLVPDIEFKLHNSTKLTREKQTNDTLDINDEAVTSSEISDESEDESFDSDLLPRIQKKILKVSSICIPKLEQKAIHISSLPLEIILYILRWVVSPELDLRSLEMFGQVCRGFYVCARDSEIWRLACLKVWGLHCGNTPGNYGSWRHMFVDRPRIRFNGCYISKTTYIRHGENSFQDQFYRPWHLVSYYRYLRFFPEGSVLMLTSADEPIQCVAQLRHRNPRSPVLSGNYRLKDNKVILVVHREDNSHLQSFKRNKRKDLHETPEQSFHVELQIDNHKNNKHIQLHWTHYSVKMKTRRGEESICVFDLVNNKFPPMWFSRVKSYTVESESPLI